MQDHSQAGGRQLQTHRPPEGIAESDYEAIEDAVMETARGRWFLKEYARRMRAVETAGLLGALQRIESMVAASSSGAALPQAPVSQMPADTMSRIEKISERLLDVSWYMRERGFDHSACSVIDTEARQLAALVMLPDEDQEHDEGGSAAAGHENVDACADLTIEAQTREEVPTVQPVESQPMEMHEAPVMAPVPPALIPVAVPAARPTLAERAAAFIHVDRMPVRQRLALFA